MLSSGETAFIVRKCLHAMAKRIGKNYQLLDRDSIKSPFQIGKTGESLFAFTNRAKKYDSVNLNHLELDQRMFLPNETKKFNDFLKLLDAQSKV